MARHKNLLWNLTELVNNGLNCPEIQIALLMDIRDEMRSLNQLLHCPNFVGIPRKLDSIRRNTFRKRRVVRK
jgi:hypothetical protein